MVIIYSFVLVIMSIMYKPIFDIGFIINSIKCFALFIFNINII